MVVMRRGWGGEHCIAHPQFNQFIGILCMVKLYDAPNKITRDFRNGKSYI